MKKWWRCVQEAFYDGWNFRNKWYGYYCAIYYILNLGAVNRLLCRMFGHKMENDAEISCDRAVEYIYCTRCGWCKRIVYY